MRAKNEVRSFGLWFRAPTAGDLLDICRNMAAMDAKEVFAINQVKPDVLAMQVYAQLPAAIVAFVIGLDNEPAAKAFLGVWPLDESRGLATAALFGTDGFPLIAGRVVRYVHARLKADMQRFNLRRVEARALKEHVAARRFIRACGAREECELVDFGINGETYVLCAWTK